MEIKVEFLNVNNLMFWTEKKLSVKYDASLSSLNTKFFSFYKTLEQMFSLLSEIYQNFQKEQSQHMMLIENSLNLIQNIINEHPKCIELNFCVNFLDTINQKIHQLQANFHPLLHIECNYSYIVNIKKVNEGFEILNDIKLQIQRKAITCVPILKYIEDTIVIFKTPLRIFIDNMKELKQQQSQQKYMKNFNEFQNQIKANKGKQNGVLVKKMVLLIKESCIYQLQIETVLDTPIKLAQIIKNKGKKLLNEDIKIENLNLILKYVNYLVKSDFIQKNLSGININELQEVFQLLQQQTNLIEELKKQPNFTTGNDEILFVEKQDFLSLYNQWDLCTREIKQIEQNQKYQKEIVQYKQSLTLSYQDVRKFSDSLYEFQQYLVQCQKLQVLFNKLQFHVQRFYLREFQERVQLVWSDIL